MVLAFELCDERKNVLRGQEPPVDYAKFVSPMPDPYTSVEAAAFLRLEPFGLRLVVNLHPSNSSVYFKIESKPTCRETK